MTIPKRLAVVGAGLIGRQHISLILQEPTARLAAVVDPTPASRQLAQSLGVAWSESLNGVDLRAICDGVIIATPNQMHVQHARICIELGIPTLIEKPIADHSVEAEAIILAAEQLGVALLVGHHRRHSPKLRDARAAILRGDLGRIVTANAMFWTHKPTEYFGEEWRSRAGGGPVFINAIHDIDCLRFLLGDVLTVQSITSNSVRNKAVEDTAVILLQFTSGTLATLSVSDTVVSPWSWEMTARENPAYPPVDESCYFIGGTTGSLSIPALATWSQPSQPSWLNPMELSTARESPVDDPLLLQLRHFVAVIDGTASPLVTGRDGLETLRVVECIHRSAREKIPVTCRTS